MMWYDKLGLLQQNLKDKTLQSTGFLRATGDACNTMQLNHTINKKKIDKHLKHIIKDTQLKSTS